MMRVCSSVHDVASGITVRGWYMAQGDHDMSGYAPEFYDPLGTESVTASICRELERQPLISLDPKIDRFEGSGLYALYYRGESVSLYAPLRAC